MRNRNDVLLSSVIYSLSYEVESITTENQQRFRRLDTPTSELKAGERTCRTWRFLRHLVAQKEKY